MNKSVLIVDDTKFTREMLKDAISGNYDVVDEASNGEECLEKVDEHNPDVVLLDVIMPTMGGLEALPMIKEKDNPPEVIMVSSVGQHKKVTEAMKKGASGYIVKPFEKEKVSKKLNEVLNS